MKKIQALLRFEQSSSMLTNVSQNGMLDVTLRSCARTTRTTIAVYYRLTLCVVVCPFPAKTLECHCVS
jgi:hypothetical protein